MKIAPVAMAETGKRDDLNFEKEKRILEMQRLLHPDEPDKFVAVIRPEPDTTADPEEVRPSESVSDIHEAADAPGTEEDPENEAGEPRSPRTSDPTKSDEPGVKKSAFDVLKDAIALEDESKGKKRVRKAPKQDEEEARRLAEAEEEARRKMAVDPERSKALLSLLNQKPSSRTIHASDVSHVETDITKMNFLACTTVVEEQREEEEVVEDEPEGAEPRRRVRSNSKRNLLSHTLPSKSNIQFPQKQSGQPPKSIPVPPGHHQEKGESGQPKQSAYHQE
jgi:hypothetical protein